VRTGTGTEPRRTLLVDTALAVGLAAFVLLGTYFASQRQPARRPFDVGAIALVLVATGALAARRRHSVAVLEVVFGAALVYFWLGYANGPIWLALIIAYVTAVFLGHRLAAGITAAAGFVIFPWLDYLVRDGRAPSPTALAGLAAWLLVLLGGAEIVRVRRERVVEAARIKEEEALRRASEERLRIARDLHDALGHHLSLINVQSGVALHLNGSFRSRLAPPLLRSSRPARRHSPSSDRCSTSSGRKASRPLGPRPRHSPGSTTWCRRQPRPGSRCGW